MRIVRALDDYRAESDLLLSIGVFDGVHVGHRAVLSRLVGQRRPGSLVGALTFARHPQEFLDPGHAPKVLTTVDEKVNLLAACGLDVLFLLPFDERIRELSPEAFVNDVLVAKLKTTRLIVGDNWRFGRDRAGDVELAKSLFARRNLECESADLLVRSGARVSSSNIRDLIGERRFAEADELLGSPYTVRGTVVAGEGRGQVLKFPTANLAIAPEKLVPTPGIYAAIARHDGKDFAAAISIGNKPTFGGTHEALEVHLLDFRSSIYGEQLALRGWRFVRDQIRYDGAASLVEQMERDVAQVRKAVAAS